MINLGPQPAAKVRSDYAFSNEVDIGSREENALNQNPRAFAFDEIKSKSSWLEQFDPSSFLFEDDFSEPAIAFQNHAPRFWNGDWLLHLCCKD